MNQQHTQGQSATKDVEEKKDEDKKTKDSMDKEHEGSEAEKKGGQY